MYKLERISMFILNEVETSHILISIRLYFILTILITEDGLQPSILSDCNFNSSAGEVSGTQASRYIGTGPGEPRKGTGIPLTFLIFALLFILYFQLKSTILREVSACPQAPKRYCSDLQYFFWRPCWPVHHNSFFTTYNKMKTKNITLSEKFQKFNRKIVEIGKFDIPNTHIHDRSLS
jgi:hypothetical protein